MTETIYWMTVGMNVLTGLSRRAETNRPKKYKQQVGNISLEGWKPERRKHVKSEKYNSLVAFYYFLVIAL